MSPPPNAIRTTRRRSFLRLVAVSVGLTAWAATAAAQSPTPTPTPELYYRARDTTTGPLTERQLDANSPASTPRGTLPVLFVHGHNTEGDEPTNPNYRKNWQNSLGTLPSFMQTLDLPGNSGLGIEDYYIRFQDQDRSISQDAAEIGEAIDLILHRHDQNYHYPDHPTTVQVVIIAYSKGTISARQYLKNLQTERPGFRPVSEFIAIAPPNHGINVSGFGGLTSISGQQLLNGYGLANCTPFGLFEVTPPDFIENLNGHDIEDTKELSVCEFYPSEAPDSRSPTEPAADGILYVTLFADQNRDFVGGDAASSDCQGRRLARNMSPDAVNIPLTIPGGSNATTVHRNTVHTFEVMCLALYAAARHHSPVGQTCMPVGSVPVILPQTRAAVMLTLDFSGSMSAAACPGCDTRATVLKDAVDQFVDLWSAVSVPSDRVGVTYFRTAVDQFNLAGAMPFLSDAAVAVKDHVRGQTPSATTAMGGGLQRAIEELSSITADTRRVILFTDGMQNVNPLVQDVDCQLVIASQPGPPAVPPTVLDPSLGIAVDTIGIGAGEAFVGLLADIADKTGGRSWPTSDPAFDLSRFFTESLINALQGFSPQLVAYRRGSINSTGSSSEAFAVEDGPHRVVLKLSWKRGDKMDFSVKKDGVDVTAAGRFIKGEFYKIFVIDLPTKGKSPIAALGNWQIQIKGKKATAYEAAAIVDGGKITYDAVFSARRPTVGEPFDLVVRSTAAGKPIDASAKVTATLMIPTTTPRDLITANPPKEPPAFEPGMTLAERQLLALSQDPKEWAKLKPKGQTVVLKRDRNGAFNTRISPKIPGIYTAVVTIDGEAAKIGKFSRTMTATTVVRTPGPANPRK